MNSRLRLAFALPRVGLHIALALVIVTLGFPFASHATRQRLIRWWSRRLLAICGMRVRVIGPGDDDALEQAPNDALDHSSTRAMRPQTIIDAMRPGGIGAMLVMNHISWIDIYVVHSVRPARFIAKSEIAKWPVIGYLTDRTGSIFIERGRRHAVRDANRRATELLGAGDLIAMCPEGTTGEGDRLLPFHANLIQPAIDARVPIVVAGLRYLDAHGRRTTAASYVGDLTLFQSMVRIIRARPITAELHLIAAIDAASATRHEVGQRARALIAETLGFDDESEEAAEGISTVIVVPDAPRTGRGETYADQPTETQIDTRDELL